MALVRRLHHFFGWVASFTAKLDEADNTSKSDIISFLRILDDAGSSMMLDAHSSMNLRIKQHRELHHSGDVSLNVQQAASSAPREVVHDVGAASSASTPSQSMNTSTLCPGHAPLHGCHVNIVEDTSSCPAPTASTASTSPCLEASASSASSTNSPKRKRRYGVANARKLSGSGQNFTDAAMTAHRGPSIIDGGQNAKMAASSGGSASAQGSVDASEEEDGDARYESDATAGTILRRTRRH
ncbi:hypothetical protein OC834_005161 [Tilletia horrida]|nr:hypothetical protein OC834_005161 [Tilletia horrida]